MRRPKTPKAKPGERIVKNDAYYAGWSDYDKAMEWPWFTKEADGMWNVMAFGPLREAGVEAEKILVARCPTKQLAREMICNRQIAEAATNWIGLIFKTLAKALMGEEARGYRDAWRRAGIPLESDEEFERATERSPINPPDPYEYG